MTILPTLETVSRAWFAAHFDSGALLTCSFLFHGVSLSFGAGSKRLRFLFGQFLFFALSRHAVKLSNLLFVSVSQLQYYDQNQLWHVPFVDGT